MGKWKKKNNKGKSRISWRKNSEVHSPGRSASLKKHVGIEIREGKSLIRP